MPNRSGPYTPKPDYDPPSQKKPSLPRGGIGVKVTYILRDERFLPPGYCCMGIK